jgi:hypothetical protein
MLALGCMGRFWQRRLKRSRQLEAIELRGRHGAAGIEARSAYFELQNLMHMCMEHWEDYQGSWIHVCTDNVGAALLWVRSVWKTRG